jgi:hypothetical protein
MTRDEYLQQARAGRWALPLPDRSNPPAEWVAAAWDIDEVREAESLEIAREVHWTTNWKRDVRFSPLLCEALSTERVVELYQFIRSCAPTWESELRAEFEKAFARHASALPPPLSPEEVAQAWSSAATREEYLRRLRVNAWHFPYLAGSGCERPPGQEDAPFAEYPEVALPPAEWIAEAWELEEVQESLVGSMARDVDKGLPLSGYGFLEMLSEALTTDQVVAFFHRIRDGSPHRESEFRPAFESAFARHAAALPPPLTREEVIEALGCDPGGSEEFLDDEGLD